MDRFYAEREAATPSYLESTDGLGLWYSIYDRQYRAAMPVAKVRQLYLDRFLADLNMEGRLILDIKSVVG